MPSFFIISHESPQQHEAFLSLPDCVAFCANAAPASASVSPSAKAGTHRLRLFISVSPLRKIIAGIRGNTLMRTPAESGTTTDFRQSSRLERHNRAGRNAPD